MEAGDDDLQGYMEDTGNLDVRTEEVSHGMMVCCVQMDKKGRV